MKPLTHSEQARADIERQEDERGLALVEELLRSSHAEAPASQEEAAAFQKRRASFLSYTPLEFASPAPSSPVGSSEDPPSEDPPQEKEVSIVTVPPTEEELKEGIIKFKIRLPGGRP